jgi:hypothetical protein
MLPVQAYVWVMDLVKYFVPFLAVVGGARLPAKQCSLIEVGACRCGHDPALQAASPCPRSRTFKRRRGTQAAMSCHAQLLILCSTCNHWAAECLFLLQQFPHPGRGQGDKAGSQRGKYNQQEEAFKLQRLE